MAENIQQKSNRWVPLALVIGVTAISFAAIFFKKAEPTHPLVSSGLRLLMASILLSPMVFRSWRAGRLSPRLFKSGLLAGVMYAVHFGAWVTSLTMTSVAASVTLVTATPLLLAIVGWVTGKDRPDKRLWLALALSIVGLLIIGGEALSEEALLGDGLALLGAAAMAGYLVIGRQLGDAMDVWAFSGIATGVGALVLCTASFALGVPLEPASTEALGYIVLATLVPQLVGHTLLTWCLHTTRPTVVGMATLGEPVGSALLAWLILGQIVTGWVALGCGLTLIAVSIAIWRPTKTEQQQEATQDAKPMET